MNPLTLLRVGLPGAMIALGIALLVFGPDEFADGAGVVLIGSGVLVALANGLLRFSIGEMADRDREQEARDFYSEHGRWPGDPESSEDPPAPAPRIPPPPDERHPGAREATPADPAGRTRPRRPRRPPRRPRPGP